MSNRRRLAPANRGALREISRIPANERVSTLLTELENLYLQMVAGPTEDGLRARIARANGIKAQILEIVQSQEAPY